MGDDASGNAEGRSHFGQLSAELAQQRVAVVAASQKQTVGWDSAQKSEEAQAMYELADIIVDRHQAFGM